MKTILKSTYSPIELRIAPSSAAREEAHLWFCVEGQRVDGRVVDASVHAPLSQAAELAREILEMYEEENAEMNEEDEKTTEEALKEVVDTLTEGCEVSDKPVEEMFLGAYMEAAKKESQWLQGQLMVLRGKFRNAAERGKQSSFMCSLEGKVDEARDCAKQSVVWALAESEIQTLLEKIDRGEAGGSDE